MRLRLRLLLVISSLLLGVLGGTFFWLFSDLRQEFRENLQASLQSSATAFRSAEVQRFRTLEVMAGALESSPAFRNVLRRTDAATLKDFLESSAQGFQVDQILVTGPEGRLLSSVEGDNEHPDGAAFLKWQGQTVSLRDYWWMDGVLYQGAGVPVVDSQGYIDGYLSVAYRVDAPLLKRLSQDLTVDLQVEHDDKVWVESESQKLRGSLDGFLLKRLPLGASDGPPKADLLMARSLAPVQIFMEASSRKLGLLALVAFAIASLVSYPLVAGLANPVEELERAQAEMQALFRSHSDGLLSLDENGLVSMANPGATVALGVAEAQLIGKSLQDLLPERVLRELLTAPSGTKQISEMEREGRRYRVQRTFLTASVEEELGSLLLFHDLRSEREQTKELDDRLAHICLRLATPASPWEQRVGFCTLRWWSQRRRGTEDRPQTFSAWTKSLKEWTAEFEKALPEGRSFSFEMNSDTDLSLDVAPSDLRLLVEILLDNALRHAADGPIVLGARKVGGTIELAVCDSGVSAPSNLEACLLGPGLGLKVARVMVERWDGKLIIEPCRDATGTRCVVSIPRGRCD